MGNMYSDAIIWNVAKGCYFDCVYCRPSFQRQAKRQKPTIDKNGRKRGCQQCYDYDPHFHPERLNINFNNKRYDTSGDKFIWAISSGEIACMREEWVNQIINKIKEYPNRTFFFQTKSPDCFYKYEFPDNVILGITMETDVYRTKITDAMPLWHRYAFFKDYEHPRKFVTIEPIMDFIFEHFLSWLRDINPERIYIGYDTKKCGLIEPPLDKTLRLIDELKKFTIVKIKYMRDV